MYRYHTPSGDKSMDGLAMALRAGLPLRDMEMVQFHPTGLLAGPDTRMTGTVLEEGLRGAGGHLLDGAKERFMETTTPAGARHARLRLPRHLRRDARRPHDAPTAASTSRWGTSGPRRSQSNSRAWWSAAPIAVSIWPVDWSRWCRRRTTSWAGWCATSIRRPSCRPLRGRRGCGWCARRQPARRQWRRQLHRVRRHRRRDHGGLDRGQSGLRAADEDVLAAELARAQPPFARKAGDLNRCASP